MTFETDYHEDKYDPSFEPKFEVENSRRSFTPYYYPERVTMDKARDLVREKGICLGEYVNDLGAENREFDIQGFLRTPELEDYHQLLDSGERFNLITMTWQGEVILKDSSLEGPVGVDVPLGGDIEEKHYLYDYNLKFVSTGLNEGHDGSSGIIQ